VGGWGRDAREKRRHIRFCADWVIGRKERISLESFLTEQ
jgi:hypothetical protein